MRGFAFTVVAIAMVFVAFTGALGPALDPRQWVAAQPSRGPLVAQAAGAETATPTPAQLAEPGPDYAATAAAAGALAAIAIGQTQQAADATAGAQTQVAAQTADARAAYLFGLTEAAGRAAMTATMQAIAGTQAAATTTAGARTQTARTTAVYATREADAHATQVLVDAQNRADSRERWTWISIAGALGLVVALIAGGFALYDWLAGRTAVERAEADRIRLLAVEEARARRQAILTLAQARPADPDQAAAAPRMPIEVAGLALPQHPAEVMHVLYVLGRCLDIAGDSSTVLPTAAKLAAAGISANARQAAVGPLVAAGLVETTPGGGTRVGGGLTLRALYDVIYAAGLEAPALAGADVG